MKATRSPRDAAGQAAARPRRDPGERFPMNPEFKKRRLRAESRLRSRKRVGVTAKSGGGGRSRAASEAKRRPYLIDFFR